MKVPQEIRNAVGGLVKMADAASHPGLQLLPLSPATKTGAFLVQPLKTARQNKAPKIGPGAAFPENETKYTEDTFKCEKYGLSTKVPDDTIAEQDEKYQVSTLAVEGEVKREELLASHDERSANKILGAGFHTVNRIGRYDTADADIVGDVRAGQAWMQARGVEADTVVVNRTLKNIIKGRIEKNRLANSGRVTAVTDADLLEYLGVANLIEFEAEYDNAAKGKDPVLAPIWPTDKLFVCKKGVPQTAMPTASGIGRTYIWENAPRGDAVVNVKLVDDENTQSTKIQVWHHTDEKIVNLNAGYVVDKCFSDL